MKTKEEIERIADRYANLSYNKDANPIDHEMITTPFIVGFETCQILSDQTNKSLLEEIASLRLKETTSDNYIKSLELKLFNLEHRNG